MNTDTVLRKAYKDIPVKRTEILRYSGIKQPSDRDIRIMEECIDEALPVMDYKVCYKYSDPSLFLKDSVTAGRFLKGAETAVVFAATAGFGIDRLILKYGVSSPVKALFFQAVGAERVESLCDIFQRDICKDNSESLYPGHRFSPGYGDFRLNMQTEITDILDTSRQIGVTLNDSLLMSPSKSVTGVFGLFNTPLNTQNAVRCDDCTNKECSFRE